MSEHSDTSERGRTFEVIYRRDGQVIEMKCDAARVEEIWRRIEDEFCERLTPEDYARFANHLKQYPPPESPG